MIDALLKNGWCYNDYGSISYLPFHDDDNFDWKTESIENWNVVLNIVSMKIEANELVGLSLTWKDTLIGGEFLFDSSGSSLSVALSINRKKGRNKYNTDFKWYLERLTKAFEQSNIKIRELETNQL